MINFIIGLVGSYFSGDMAAYWFWPLLALGFLSFIPHLINSLFAWRD